MRGLITLMALVLVAACGADGPPDVYPGMSVSGSASIGVKGSM